LPFAVSAEAAELVSVPRSLLQLDLLKRAGEELVRDDGALRDSGVVLLKLREGE
jgi:hypothetical protein